MNAVHSKAVHVALILSTLVFILDASVGYVFLSAIILIVCILHLPIFLVLSIFKIGRSTTLGLLILLCCPIGINFYGKRLDADAMKEAEPITQAIKRFKTHSGQYPSSLDELVPKYVNSTADLSPIGLQRKLEYRTEHLGPILFFKNGAVFSHRAYQFWDDRWVQND